MLKTTPWTLLDTAPIPGSESELCLYQSNKHFSISINSGGQLMNTIEHESEDVLASRACQKIADRPQPRVLIGGLGMGFTLAAALLHMGDDAEVVVGELVPQVVTWNRGPLGEHAGNPLQDPRTRVRVGDVSKIIKAERNAYDAILLDVDNGPEGLTRKKNNWLYSMDGLTESYSALRPGGILAVWSASSDRDFMERLRKIGFKVQQTRVRADGKRGDLHAIWFAERGP
jgi:spermidine synthase